MQIIEWPRFLEDTHPEEKPSAVTVGVFDGVHRGHQALIEQVVSQQKDTVPAVITFVQSRYKKAGNILSFRQKIAIFENLGVSLTIVIEYSESFRRTTGAEFLDILQNHGNMRFMAVGSNFRCGYQLDTDAAAIQKYNALNNIPTCIVQPLTENAEPISSSHIRAAITQGNLKAASAMLGRPFTVDLAGASVVHTGSGSAYDIASQGRILPPPGRYPVVFPGKNSDTSIKNPVEIQVEEGTVIISGDLPVKPEFVEFLT